MKPFINSNSPIPKYQQLVSSIVKEIQNGTWKLNDKLPSVNQLCIINDISRDTVLLAYNELKSKGIVEGRSGKGYYVSCTKVENKIQRIFLLFDELNSFKEQLHNSFVNHLPKDVKLDVYFHYFNEELFARFIKENQHRYDAYVIMPVWFRNIEKYIGILSPSKLVMLDQWPNGMPEICSGVYQDFYRDILLGLTDALPYIEKYKCIRMIHPGGKEPEAMIEGAKDFASNNGFNFKCSHNLNSVEIKSKCLYLVINDGQLLEFCAMCKKKGLIPGKDIGLISYNDSPFKPFIFDGIATISTDFSRMGKRLAEIVFASQTICEKNPAHFIYRKSV